MFEIILFDVDGVILSEERYFDASALTVWELLTSPNYLGVACEVAFTPRPSEEEIRKMRRQVFQEDEVLHFIKSRGINANWDMVYLAFSYQLIRFLEAARHQGYETVAWLSQPITRESLHILHQWDVSYTPQWAGFVPDFSKGNAEKQALLLDLNRIAETYLGQTCRMFGRNSLLWDICRETFQEWYLGEEKLLATTGQPPVQSGKKGFLHDEIPVVPQEEMIALFASLQREGIVLGLGTGRPTLETIEPLSALGVLRFFDPNRVITASDVLETERRFPERAPLAKPHPYTYLKALLGKQTPDEKVFSCILPLQEGNKVLIVGDSVADLMAARSMGCIFCATLTGLSGQKARKEFEELGANYIVDSLLDVQKALSYRRC